MTMPAMKRQVTASYDDVLARIVDALKSEGFGVLTEIDVQRTLKDKIGADFRRYKILGACNPTLAHQALGADLDVGVMLPCNVVVYEGDDDRTVISAMDPEKAIGPYGGDEVKTMAKQVKAKLERVLELVV